MVWDQSIGYQEKKNLETNPIFGKYIFKPALPRKDIFETLKEKKKKDSKEKKDMATTSDDWQSVPSKKQVSFPGRFVSVHFFVLFLFFFQIMSHSHKYIILYKTEFFFFVCMSDSHNNHSLQTVQDNDIDSWRIQRCEIQRRKNNQRTASCRFKQNQRKNKIQT